MVACFSACKFAPDRRGKIDFGRIWPDFFPRMRALTSGMRDEPFIDILRNVPLFSALTDAELRAMGAHCAVQQVPKGHLIFRDGDAYYGFYIVMKGSVKVYKLTRAGRETILHVIGPGNTLAEIPMFTGGSYPAYASTLEPATLLCVYKDGFLSSLAGNPDLALKMFAGLSRRIRNLAEQLERVTSLDVRMRLLRWLRDAYDRQQPSPVEPAVTLAIPKSQLAAELGTIVETLSRALKKLEREGLIRVARRRIVIADPARFRAACED
jgi:CRP/FNR family transcriptional regulator, dissimilatory nitrate respiration regulator